LACKEIIRVGDKVKIIKPEFFVRCGYDLTFESAMEQVEEKYSEKILGFINEFNSVKIPSILIRECDYRGHAFERIVKALAYELIRNQMKDGNERKIITELEEERLNKECTVRHKFHVHTGIYNKGHYYKHSAFDGGDYDPPFLSNLKVHTILQLDFYLGNFVNSMDTEHATGLAQIDSLNVIKIVGGEKDED
jgi:hypothetical protein